MATQPLLVLLEYLFSQLPQPYLLSSTEKPTVYKPGLQRSSKSYPGNVPQACPGTPRRWGFTDGTVWQGVLTYLFIHHEVERQHHPKKKLVPTLNISFQVRRCHFLRSETMSWLLIQKSDVWSVEVFFSGQPRSIVPRKILRDAKDDVNGLMSQRRKHQHFMVLNSLGLAT